MHETHTNVEVYDKERAAEVNCSVELKRGECVIRFGGIYIRGSQGYACHCVTVPRAIYNYIVPK